MAEQTYERKYCPLAFNSDDTKCERELCMLWSEKESTCSIKIVAESLMGINNHLDKIDNRLAEIAFRMTYKR